MRPDICTSGVRHMPGGDTMPTEDLSAKNVPLERDMFLHSLLRELSSTLEDIVGIEEASGYI